MHGVYCELEDSKLKKDEVDRFLSVLRRCEEMLEINPNVEDALFSKGTVLAKLERYEESIDCLDRLTELDPRYPSVWRLKSTIYRMMNKRDMAEECERMAQRLERENEENP